MLCCVREPGDAVVTTLPDMPPILDSNRTGAVDEDRLLSVASPPLGRAGSRGAARAVVTALGSRGQGGAIDVTEGGRTRRLGRGEVAARVTVHDRRVYRALLRSGSVGLGSSYVAGWWDTDDLTAVVAVLLRRTRPLRHRLDRLGRAIGPVLDLPARLGAPGRDDDRRNVRAHYDLSNEFFALMLDETMTYSCAVFERPGMTLRDAQRAKIDRLCRKLDLRPVDRVVEIGSGWGSLALHAAERYGCRVTTTTISEAQQDCRGQADRRCGPGRPGHGPRMRLA